MKRIPGISDRQAGLGLKLTYFFTRRAFEQLTGRDAKELNGSGLEPLEIYALIPGLLKGLSSLVQATGKLHALDEKLRNLAELKAATLTSCEYCIDLGSQVARRSGMTDEKLLALPFYKDSPLFSDLEKLVLDYAVGMSHTPVDVPDALFDELHEHLSDAQLVELTHVIALETMYGRCNLAVGIGAAGFSAGMVCALPVTAAAQAAK